jgi:formate-dependent nitrite reductase membrane component NrfD
MLSVFSFLLTAVIIISLIFSVFYSYRYRTQTHPIKKGVFAAKMNIAMGFMLVSMAILQIFLFDANTIRTLLGIVFLLMGLFNFFSGVRNHMFYRAQKK